MPDQHHEIYSSLSQRIADSLARSLSQMGFENIVPEGAAELATFFRKWYGEIAASPKSFGLPVIADMCIDDDASGDKAKQAVVTQRVKKIRECIDCGLELLLVAGTKGRLRDNAILLGSVDWTAYLEKRSRLKKAMFKGLNSVGLTIAEVSEGVIINNDQYPHMIPAMKSLVEGCAQAEHETLVLFHLSRCDFHAKTPNYEPDPADLYRVFPPAEYERLMTLHRYFLSKKYRYTLQVNGIKRVGNQIPRRPQD
jgi:hypothetical protein